MKIITKFIKNYWFLMLANLLIVIVSLINKLPSGYIVAHGDGYQFFNSSFIKHFIYTWDDLNGQGAPLTLFANYPYYILTGTIRSILRLSSNYQVSLNYIIILMGSFWSFYLSLGLFFNQKSKHNIMALIALVYSFNLYTLHIFLDEWGCSPFFLIYVLVPIIIGLTYKIFLNKGMTFNLFLSLGIVFVVENIVNSNLSFFIAVCLILLLLITFMSFFNRHLDIRKIVAYGLIILLATMWSILPQFFALLRQSSSYIGDQSVFNINEWIIWQSSRFPDVFFFIFDFSNSYLHKIPLTVAGICLFVLYIISIIKEKSSYFNSLFMVLMMADIFLINKGKGILPKDIITFIFQNPILASLRSFDKTAILLPFLVLIVIAGYLINQKVKNSNKLAVVFLVLFSILSVYPFFTGKVLEKHSISFPKGQDYLSVKYSPIVQIPKDYFQIAEKLNYGLLDVKILRAPYNVINSVGWVNFPKWKHVGTDPTIQLFDNSTVQMNIVGYFGLWNYGSIWNSQSIEKSEWILPFSGLLNSKYFVYHKDVDEKFVRQTKYKVESYEKSNDIRRISDNDFFTLYQISDKYFLPHFYSPTNILIAEKVELLPELLSKPDYNIRSAVFVTNQNDSKIDQISALTNTFDGNPTIEFKKINPTKYRLIVHKVKNKIPLVFSESYNDDWKAYLVEDKELKVESRKSKDELLNQANANYKILEGNDEDQASKEELISFINEGLITSLGDNKQKETVHFKWQDGKETFDFKETHNIDFISKNFKGTIQNDNLDNGSVAETWFKDPLDEKNHLKANGYANSWLINADEICKDSNKCIQNSDGTYDIELIAEFWPQRLFYLGLFISGSTLFMCVMCLIYYKRKNKRLKNEK